MQKHRGGFSSDNLFTLRLRVQHLPGRQGIMHSECFFWIRWMSWKAPGTSRMRFLFFCILHTAALLTLKSPCSRITFYILSVGKATKTSDGSIGHKRLGVVEWKLYWPATRWSKADVTPADRFPSSPCSRGALKMAPTWIFPFHLDLFA